jgi:hypothetical protein
MNPASTPERAFLVAGAVWRARDLNLRRSGYEWSERGVLPGRRQFSPTHGAQSSARCSLVFRAVYRWRGTWLVHRLRPIGRGAGRQGRRVGLRRSALGRRSRRARSAPPTRTAQSPPPRLLPEHDRGRLDGVPQQRPPAAALDVLSVQIGSQIDPRHPLILRAGGAGSAPPGADAHTRATRWRYTTSSCGAKPGVPSQTGSVIGPS